MSAVGYLKTLAAKLAGPIDMVLFCQNCGKQHVDAPEPCDHARRSCEEVGCPGPWTNPPHRSHRCGFCRFVWRPADVPTNGVESVKTKGRDDFPDVELSLADQLENYRWELEAARKSAK